MGTFTIETTQNIGIQYQLAGVLDRIGAYLIDILVLIAMATLLMSIMSAFPGDLLSSYIIFFAYIPVLVYRLLAETLFNGQTIGKMALSIKVVKTNGQPAGISNYLLRWIFQTLDFYLMGSVALIFIMTGEKGQRLGDLVAGTTVIKKNNSNLNLQNNLHRNVEENYQPVFAEAARLDEKHIRLIRKTIATRLEYLDEKPTEMLAQKLGQILDVKYDMRPQTFLNTLLKDYTYFHKQEEERQKTIV